MSILAQLKNGEQTCFLDFQAITKHLPFILLVEELGFRVLPFALPNLAIASFLSVFLDLTVHTLDRKLYQSNNVYAAYFLAVHTLIAFVFALIYLKFGFCIVYIVHLLYDYVLLTYLNWINDQRIWGDSPKLSEKTLRSLAPTTKFNQTGKIAKLTQPSDYYIPANNYNNAEIKSSTALPCEKCRIPSDFLGEKDFKFLCPKCYNNP